MSFDTERGRIFLRHDGRTIRHMEKHRGLAMDFWYVDVNSGVEFDIRDFTTDMLGGVPRESVLSADRDSHRQAIINAIDNGTLSW